MNVIDMVAICPFYINLILEGLEDFEIIGKTGKIIRLVRGKPSGEKIISFDNDQEGRGPRRFGHCPIKGFYCIGPEADSV